MTIPYLAFDLAHEILTEIFCFILIYLNFDIILTSTKNLTAVLIIVGKKMM